MAPAVARHARRARATKPACVDAYTTPEAAATRALRLVLAYSGAPAPVQDAIVAAQAPEVRMCVPRRKGARRPLVVVFDIDDTVVRDMEETQMFALNAPVVALHKAVMAAGAHVHFVTARSDNRSTTEWTQEQLATLGLKGHTAVHAAPERHRGSMADVSAWKRSVRAELAAKYGVPVVLSVGDQFGDMVVLQDDDDIDRLDDAMGVARTPWLVLRPHDGVTLWGLKLKAFK